MAIITLQPESVDPSSTLWTGLPNSSVSGQWENLNEGVASADNDVSYSNFTSISGNALILNFQNPTVPADKTILFVRLLIKWRPTSFSSTSLRVVLDGPLSIVDENMIINSSADYFTFSCGQGVCTSPPTESNRVPLQLTEDQADLLTVTLKGLDENLRVTAIEIELGTGVVETASGGGVLGGVADLGDTRTGFGGALIGGAVADIYVEFPSGGVLVLPSSNIRDFNDATPFLDGGTLVGGKAVEAFFPLKKGFLKKTFDISKDLLFTYSGGELNNSPDASLGGDASPVLILPGLNNLFDDITPLEADEGQIDYRCFYIFNDHATETIFNIKAWINSQVIKGADVKLGIDSKDELQSVVLDATPDTGYFTVRYEASDPFGFAPVKVERPIGLTGDALLTEFASNFQEALRVIPDLRDVLVNASIFGTGISFEVLFEKLDGKRDQEALTIVENVLSPSVNILIRRIVRGSPINSTAAAINQDITPPGAVVFSAPTSEAPFVIPKLREGEGFHLWVERTVVPNDEDIANDGFFLGLSIEPIEPLVVA
tara:strand:- start:5816 stop:7450 length:1635 start_codon:yes stop_codon:yes gene_type:complete